MSSLEVCQHCSRTVRTASKVFEQGYSYHRSCRKCYVCSESNLRGAEVFRGVIFCASCARRIFKGCAKARCSKQPPRNVRRRRRRRHVEQNIIERARANSSCSSYLTSKPEAAVPVIPPSHDCYCVDVVTQARKLINFIYFQTQNRLKTDTTGVVNCTEVCQRMLEDLKCPLPHSGASRSGSITDFNSEPNQVVRNMSALKANSTEVGTSHSFSRFRSRRKERKRRKKKEAPPCSDLRIAELGASVEIANMALRRTSTKKVKSESIVPDQKTEREPAKPETISMFSNVDTATSQTSNEEYLDSECQDYRGTRESRGRLFDHSFRSLVKIPYRYFKRKIIERSSLVSIIARLGDEQSYKTAFKNLRRLFHDEILEHQHNGYKKLYSTINKRNIPYKLGWLEDIPGDFKPSPCKHFAECHSYRCMRQQVMRLAGPTESKMYGFRSKVKQYVLPPFLRNISFQNKPPTTEKPAACSKSRSQVSRNPESPDLKTHAPVRTRGTTQNHSFSRTRGSHGSTQNHIVVSKTHGSTQNRSFVSKTRESDATTQKRRFSKTPGYQGSTQNRSYVSKTQESDATTQKKSFSMTPGHHGSTQNRSFVSKSRGSRGYTKSRSLVFRTRGSFQAKTNLHKCR